MNSPFDVIILAGGKGKRMNSDLPKSLHPVGGMPTIRRVLAGAFSLCAEPIVVVGDKATEVMAVAGKKCRYVFQQEQRGTGHAVKCVKESIGKRFLKENVMVLPGDHPLIRAETLAELSSSHLKSQASLTLCTFTVPDFENHHEPFSNYGRIRRNDRGELAAIVEAKDATEAERNIKEVNVGYYCFQTSWLWENIGELNDRNAAGEFYLTDLVGIAIEKGARVNAYALKDPEQGMGFNTPEQLEMIRRIKNLKNY